MRTEKERPRTQPASGVVLSVDDRPGSADAHHGGGQFFPGLAAADAVGRQPYSALEAFQGVWSAQYARSGSTLTSLGTDENGAPLPFCTVSGTDITLYTITNEVDLTYPATLKDGVLSMSAQEKGQTLIVELFQTEEGGMYATFSVNIVGMSNTLVLELSPVE